jgi:NAD(P)-dependent dehydrogenase (short-subunit alcohol dehydrogenase family)
MLATNLTEVFLAARAAVPVTKKQRRGTILAVSSMAGFVAYPGFPGYAAAKHGVNGLVKGMSLSLGAYGIRANALCPAHGMSINFAMPPDVDVLGKSYEEMQPWDPAANSIPLKLDRPPNLRDNAYAALYLVSDESSYYRQEKPIVKVARRRGRRGPGHRRTGAARGGRRGRSPRPRRPRTDARGASPARWPQSGDRRRGRPGRN